MELEIKKNVKLADYSTFKIGGLAKYFVVVKSEDDFIVAIKWAKRRSKKIFVLGGGSNILFSDKGFDGLVIKNEIKGMEVVGENEDSAIIKSYSGEAWSKMVNFSISRNYYGIENMFYIFGTVGAAPVQNIGAYGVELKDIFYNLCAIDLKTGEKKYFNLKDCQFAYRDSIFKNKLKNKYFVLWVELKLSKKEKFNLEYGDIKNKLAEKGIENPKLKDVAEVIQEIRNLKLPNPGILPNAGSFFKNPVISEDEFKILKDKFSDIKSFPDQKGIKIPAGWLIEQVDVKGYRHGDAGVYENQALILVNHGSASQKDVLFLVDLVKKNVFDKFGIILEAEVNILK
ncbi:MAG: UDP-N-acetylmuramate dehydrogenase [Patescibacteria group bacterium]|nr:UDP-N-acetylmuramate dehydrogenase [Patescibacteria group bacterium]